VNPLEMASVIQGEKLTFSRESYEIHVAVGMIAIVAAFLGIINTMVMSNLAGQRNRDALE
jgi:hypothetical protein